MGRLVEAEDVLSTTMAPETLLPSREPVESDPDVEMVSLDDAGTVIEALSSSTARSLVSAIHQEPRTIPDLADLVGTSNQNVHYHMENLQDAGVVRVVDTWYSSRGTEMDVYGPASDPLLVFAGVDPEDTAVDEALSRCHPIDQPST